MDGITRGGATCPAASNRADCRLSPRSTKSALSPLQLRFLAPMKFAPALLGVLLATTPLLSQDAGWNYLGETPPEDTPKRFPLPSTPGFFAAERIALSHDGRSLYFTELNGYSATSVNRLLVSTCTEGKWSAPTAIFSGKEGLAPALTSDGSRLLLNDRIATRQADGTWGPPVAFRPGVKCHYLQQTNTGHLYYAVVNKEGTEFDLVRAGEPADGSADTMLGLALAMKPPFPVTLDFFLARDESYVILFLCGARDYPSAGASDLAIAFRQPDGSWTKPRSLGAAINTPAPNEWRWGPYVSDDGKYLFFSRQAYLGADQPNNTHIEWVRFDRLLERLKSASP